MRSSLIVISSLAGLGALSSCGPGEPYNGDSGRSHPRSLPFGQAPIYATAVSEDGFSSLTAHSTYDSGTVEVFQYGGDPVHVIESVTLTPLACPQAVHIGTTNTAIVFVLVVSTDYANDIGYLQSFVDADADGLPEAAGTLIAQRPNAHLFAAAFDRASGTLYIADALGDRVLRVGDTTGDRIPDTSAASVFVGPGGAMGSSVAPRRLASPGPTAVRVFRKPSEFGQNPRTYVECRDTDGDGTADIATPGELERAFARFVTRPFGGDGTVKMEVHASTAFIVQAKAGPGQYTDLGSASGSAGIHEVRRSRALMDGETLRIFDAARGESLSTVRAFPRGETVITTWSSATAPPMEGGSIVVAGKNITGQETARGLKSSEDDGEHWRTLSVASHTRESLTLTVPEFGLTRPASILIEIATRGGRKFDYVVTVVPD